MCYQYLVNKESCVCAGYSYVGCMHVFNDKSRQPLRQLITAMTDAEL